MGKMTDEAEIAGSSWVMRGSWERVLCPVQILEAGGGDGGSRTADFQEARLHPH